MKVSRGDLDRVPVDDILRSIDMYDSSKPKMDELKFVHDLAEKYACSEAVIVARIREVRKLRKKGML